MAPRISLASLTERRVLSIAFRSRHQPISPQCPFRNLQTTTPVIDPEAPIEPLGIPSQTPVTEPSSEPTISSLRRPKGTFSPQYDPARAPSKPSPEQQNERTPLLLTPAVRERYSLLASQPPFYATIHIHGKPYLVTQGDTIRLPFLMHGVQPGDVLRLNRATSLGSRDFTLMGGQPNSSPIEAGQTAGGPVITAEPIVGKTEGLQITPYPTSSTSEAGQDPGLKKKGPPIYVDDRMFVCRATVMGTEAEPMRIKEKTKRRQRHVKTVRSKHKYTVVTIKELSLRPWRDLEEETQSSA